MATEVILPRVDMDMTEGKIALWHVKDGDRVSKGQVLFEMETDKATMEVEADADGVIQGISGSLDTAIPVGQVLAWILREGESLPTATTLVPNKTLPAQGAASAEEAGSAQLQSQGSEATEASKTTQATEPTDAVEVNAATLEAETPEKNSEHILRATPLARAIAREQGIDLRAVQGSGEAGRIYAVDVKQTGAGKRRKADVNADLHLHWFARNGSNPLVMLHGFGSDLGSWRPLVGQMSGLSLLGIDLPNHGKSARSEVADFETLARMLVAKLDDEGVNAVHLLGHSMGGAAALAMAGLLGPRLRSLTLVAPAGFGPEINGAFIQGVLRASREESLRPWLAQLFGDGAALSASFVATAWQQLRSPEKRQALASMADRFFPDGTQAESLRARAGSLDVPIKVVWGALDRIIPVHQSAGLPGNCALHLFSGAGHLPQVEQAPLLARLLRQQIASAAATDP